MYIHALGEREVTIPRCIHCYTSQLLHSGYVRTGSYSIRAMGEREGTIRGKAEATVANSMHLLKRWIFNKILYHARRGVKHRENLRFARTRLFGVFRDLFRAIGSNLVRLGLLKTRQVSAWLLQGSSGWLSQREKKRKSSRVQHNR